MNFKTKKIRKHIPQKPPEKVEKIDKIIFPDQIRRNRKVYASIGISIAIIFLLVFGIVKAIGSIDFKILLKAAGDDLKQDSYGHTNFLILGTGGKNHEGGDLTDSIILASLDQENKLITMISIPRDLYIKDPEVGNSRINEIYYNAKNAYTSSSKGLDYMLAKVESIMGVPIHYYLKVDFKGFKELVDAIGGIDVNVESAIYDPSYPKDGTFLYETFSISAGQHHLDGATALKYARSRKTTSDFDRANRQQQIIYAIKEKALSTEILFSQSKITEILDTLKDNIETNITVKEILTLGSIASDYNSNQISHRLIHDDPTQCGGFLYTPAREFYNGMFVLLPAGGFESLHQYSDLTLNLPQIANENAKIQIFNGTNRGGAAGETKQILKRFCFDITRFGNGRSKEVPETTYYYKEKKDAEGNVISKRPLALDFLQKLIPGKESMVLPQEYIDAGYMNEADLIIEIGADYANTDKYIADPFYSLPIYAPSLPETPVTEEAKTTTEEPTTTEEAPPTEEIPSTPSE